MIRRSLLAAAGAALILAPLPAAAQKYNYDPYDPAWAAYEDCRKDRRKARVAGAIVGGILGGLAGNKIPKRRKGLGTGVGAAAGVAAGQQVGKELADDCDKYVPRANYDYRAQNDPYAPPPPSSYGRQQDYAQEECRWDPVEYRRSDGVLVRTHERWCRGADGVWRQDEPR